MPEALDELVHESVTREGAIALAERVVSNCGGLESIAKVSNAVHSNAHNLASLLLLLKSQPWETQERL